MMTKSLVRFFLVFLVFSVAACGPEDEENQEANANANADADADADGDADADSDADADADADGEVELPYADCTVGLEATGEAATDYEVVQTAFLEASEGDVICFFDGDYSFEEQISLQVSGVEVRGESRDGVRLDFSNQDGGSSGIDVQDVEGFTLRSLSVLNTAGDGVVVRNSTWVTFDDVAVIWEGGPDSENGAYGLYPVQSEYVVVENTVVSGASDAGIYLGQSVYGIIRNNEVYENVAGIEVENSTFVDVHDNEVYENTGGILIFNLPNLQRKEGGLTRVYDNLVTNNNGLNFTSGGIVQYVPMGTGVLLIAVQDVEVFGNEISDHGSISVGVVSYQSIPLEYDDEEYYPFAEGIYVHDNVMTNSGYNPDGLAAGATSTRPVPAILWDGLFNPEADADEARSCFSSNMDDEDAAVSFLNLRAYDEELGETTERGENDCTRTSLEPVQFEQE